MSSIGVEVSRNEEACQPCPFFRGYVDLPDGKETIKKDSKLWELISYAYCYLANLFNVSDAEQASKYEIKKGPVPYDCPKKHFFKATGVIK